MARAWPFENVKEGGSRPGRYSAPQDFVESKGDGVEAVIVRIGLNDTQLVLVDEKGEWDRWVYLSVEEAREKAAPLGVPVHEGEFPEPLRVRMNSYRRPAPSFDRGAYPEQGRVGPVINYPENRPRLLEGPPQSESDAHSG